MRKRPRYLVKIETSRPAIIKSNFFVGLPLLTFATDNALRFAARGSRKFSLSLGFRTTRKVTYVGLF